MDVKYVPADWEKMRSGIKGLIGYGVYGKGMFEDLKKLNEVLEDAEGDIAKYDVDGAISFSHTSQKSTYQSMFEKFEVLYQFTGKVDNIVDQTIDQPFYEDMDAFVAAMEEATISKYETTNRIGATETQSIGYDMPTVIEVPKAKVSLDDLLSGGNFYSEQMQLEFEEWKKLNPDQDLSQEEYQLAAVNMRAFEYESIRDKQENVEFWTQIGALVVIVGVSFICLPAGLILGGIYGTLELGSALSGEDWASHRELGTGERWFRGLLAPLDIIPATAVFSHYAGSAGHFARLTDNLGSQAVKLGAREGVQQTAKNIVDDAALETTSRIRNAEAALEDQTSVNALKAVAGDDYNLANAASSPSPLNLTSTRKMNNLVDDVGVVNKEHITRLLEKTNCNSDELYQYLSRINKDLADDYLKTGKWPDNAQVPKDSKVLKENGDINWDEVPQGGYTLDANGKAIKESYIPEMGEVIDRYGPPNGRYTSPVQNNKPYNYEQRSLPYVEDPSIYHQYRVTGDFNNIERYFNQCQDPQIKDQIMTYMERYDLTFDDLKIQKGEIASGFGSVGGGIQYELPLPVDMLEAIGLLKEI